MPASPTAKFIPCSHAHCTLSAGWIEPDRIVFYVRHHGEKHRITLTLAELQRLLAEQSDINPLTHVAKVCSTPAVKT